MIAHDCHLLHDHSNHTPKPPGPSTRLEGWSECLQEAQERQERWKMWCLVGTWKTNLHGYLTDPGFPTDTQSRLGTTSRSSRLGTTSTPTFSASKTLPPQRGHPLPSSDGVGLPQKSFFSFIHHQVKVVMMVTMMMRMMMT